MEVNENKRIENENEYLALLLNKNKVIDVTKIEPKYLYDSKNKVLLDSIIKCYKKYGVTDINKMLEINPSLSIDRFAEVFTDTIVYDTNWQEHLRIFEETIVKYYKIDVIKTYNKKLENNQSDSGYDNYVENIKKLDDIIISHEIKTINEEELLNNIDDNKTIIALNNYNKLSRYLKLVQNDFMIIGAMTGTGKSGFMLNLMSDLMFRYQCVYFNLEMSKSTIYKRLISINSGVPLDAINEPTEYQRQLIKNAINDIVRDNIYIDHKANDIKEIKNIISRIKKPDRHTIVFIDHLGLCRCDNSKSLYEQATEVAKELRQICLNYDCTIISASQLNRSAYSSDSLSLSMLKDSGELENSASKVVLLSRSKEDKNNMDNTNCKMDLDIVKNRDGILGSIRLKYDKTKQIFTELNDF
jgi:replicative DNA helicase